MRRRIVLVLVAITVVSASAYAFSTYHASRQLDLAREEIRARRWQAAVDRLEALDRVRILIPKEHEADFLRGLGLWALGRREEALRLFDRLPRRGGFAAKAAIFRVETLYEGGRLREVENLLQEVLADPTADHAPAREWLNRLYRIEARFGEVRDLLRTGLTESREPARVLHDLWLLDRASVPLEPLKAELDRAGRVAPDDDRVWLGRARLALLDGRIDESRQWLDRCVKASQDGAVRLACLDWAKTANRPREAAVQLGRVASTLTIADRAAWTAWLCEQAGDHDGERKAVESWLKNEPSNPQALEKAAELVQRAGESSQARGYLDRKSRVDEALDAYRVQMNRNHWNDLTQAGYATMADLARRAGLSFDAKAWEWLAQGRPRGGLWNGNGPASPSGDAKDDIDWNRLINKLADSTALSVTGSTRIRFRELAEASGLHFTFQNGETPIRQMPEPLSGGLALLDYDNDGRLDLYVTQGGPFPPQSPSPCADRLFRNVGAGRFEDWTDRAGISKLPGGYGHGVTAGDYDGDGDTDIFVTRWRSYGLWRNRGDGTFEDATEASGLGGDRGWPTSAALADLDGDGDLDLYVCHYLRWTAEAPPCRDGKTSSYMYCAPRSFPSEPDGLYRNVGGRFIDVSAESGVTAADADGRGLGVVVADLDGDAKLDLFVANDTTANFFFRNLGGLRFEEAGHAAGLAANAAGGYQAGMGVACGDADGDGQLDIAVTNFYGEGTTLYHNLGQGLFCDRSAASGLATSRYRLGFGIAFLDADNDGSLDLVTANGHLNDLGDTPYRMPPQVFQGSSRGAFRDVTSDAGDDFTKPRLGRAMAAGDVDNDGKSDLILIDHNAPLAYFHNESTGAGHWISLRLEGQPPNRDAIGTVVTLRSGDHSWVAQRMAGGSYQAASDPRLHFGLGSGTGPMTAEIRWPAGRAESVAIPKVDAAYVIREGTGRASVAAP